MASQALDDVGVEKTTRCSVCSKILEFIALPVLTELPKKHSIGTVASLLSSDCKDHVALVNFVKRHEPGKVTHNAELQLCRPVDVVSGVYLTIARTPECSEVVDHLHLQQRACLPPAVGRSVRLDEDWIDINLLHQWQRTCVTHHSAKCESPYTVFNIQKVNPLWLIDTQQLCLVPGAVANSFVTLSYVWGDLNPFTTTTNNISQLRIPGAFAPECFGKLIPKTIANCIGLVPLLGERFLWVDALCIVQDDDASKTNEIHRMAAIYASSSLTIIAGDGVNCHHGLRGIRGVSNHRQVEQKVEPFGSANSLVGAIFSRAHEILHRSRYRDRAWTFQEAIFAKRRIIFHNGSVRWMCSESLWDEDLLPLDLDDSPKKRSFSVLRQDGCYPSFSLFGVAVNSFNRRELTYPEDAVYGITGFLDVLSQTFEGGFLFGMPEAFFDIALLWEPAPGMTKRKPMRPLEELTPLLRVPSWSWAAWTGRYVAGAWFFYDTTDNDINPSTLRHVIPTVQWFTMSSPASAFRRRIESKWFEYRFRAQNPELPLPPGWERHKDIGETSEERSSPTYFTHSLVPGKRWRSPFPIPLQSGTRTIPEPVPYIFCRTSHAFLIADSPDEDIPSDDDRAITCSLRDMYGNWVGVLLQHLDSASPVLSKTKRSKTVELVAISQTRCTPSEEDYVEERRYGKLPTDAPYEYYNVLWIRRDSGVAYRNGLGRVLKAEWQRLMEDEMIDLTLG